MASWARTSVIFACAGLYATVSSPMVIKPRSDRRRRKRQLLNTSVQVFTESAHLDALGINVTDVGMCLFTMANLPVGSRLGVEFVPRQGSDLVRRIGIIRHRAVYLYGIEFLDSHQLSDIGMSVAQLG